jgi:FkbM family methyltransferase
MKKSLINNICRKFGFEVHGVGYIQSVSKQAFKEDAYLVQQSLSEKAKIIFDVGANRGDTVARYLELYPAAKIYAFEPFPDTFKVLHERYKENPRVHCYPLAVADLTEPKIFYVNENVDTNSLLKPKATGLSSDKQVENKKQITVETVTLDNFCSANGILEVDILKMDIQGGELAALKGAEKLLKAQKIGLIYSETYFVQQYENQPLFHDISKFVFSYDYMLKDIYAPIYGKGNLAWGDVIFVKKVAK